MWKWKRESESVKVWKLKSESESFKVKMCKWNCESLKVKERDHLKNNQKKILGEKLKQSLKNLEKKS